MLLFKKMGKFSISAANKNSYNILDILKSKNRNKTSGLQYSVMFYAVYPIFFGVGVTNPDWNRSQNFSRFACFCPMATLTDFVTRNQAIWALSLDYLKIFFSSFIDYKLSRLGN